MSAITQTGLPPNATASVWNRGPPSQANSGNSTPQVNGTATPPAANGITVNLNGNANGSGPNGTAPIPVGHSRKGSIMVGGGMDIKRGNIAFGTVDNPNPDLSSSPAAPSMIGSHLADAVKSFGSIDAASADPDSVRAPARKTSTLASATSPTPEAPVKKQLDMHSLFSGKPAQPQGDRRQSMGQNGTGGQNGPSFPNPQQQQFRPPNMMPGAPPYGQYRPSQSGLPYGMPQQGYMQYPQGYNPGYYGQQQQQQQYPNPQQQWAPQQHPQHQGNMMSPRGLHPQASPAPLPQGLPNGSSPHLAPQQVRPPGPVPNGLPSTPSRQMQPTPVFTPNASSFTPGSQFSMSSGAASFTPRTSKAIKIARDDGTEVDLKTLAPAPKSTPSAPAAAPATEGSAPAKKPYSLPVVVRLESEEQKTARLKEEAKMAEIKAIEAAEDKERKERKERKAKEAEEQRLADEKAKTEQEEKAKADAEAASKKAEDDAKAEKEKAAAAEKEKADADAKEKADKAAADKVEGEKAVPTTPATPASPSVPSAGLPAKPSPIVTGSPALSSVEESHSALSAAQPINDLPSITYPSKFNPPNPSLNADAEPGKYRYDREFLLQFMQLCKEKPEGLPSLEDIGLEADTSSGFGGSRSTRGGQRTATRGAPTGLGIGGIGRSGAGSGMGAFGTGNFGSMRGTTSEDRYAKSLSQRGSSSRPPQGLPPMAPSTSRRGGPRDSQRGGARGGNHRPPPPFYGNNEPEVAPLVASNNSWVKARPTDNDESSPAFVERKVKALLNKLTQEKFDSISKQILEWANRSKNETDGMSLKLVIKQIFEKATDEAHWSEMYGRLCRRLLDDLDPEVTDIIDDKPMSGGVLFRKYLIGRCQMDFEAGWKARAEADSAAAAKQEEDKERLAKGEKEKEEGKEPEAVMLSDEYYAAQKAKRRGLGLVQLVGELYKLSMISPKVIKTCLQTLLTNITDPDEEDVESTCKLLTTVGGQFEAQAADTMAQVMGRLEVISKLPATSSRVKFMILDIMDLQKHGWRGKKTASSVMTIAEIHQQAAREQAQKTAAAAQSTRESMSRGGSRAGRQRDGHDWQTPQQPVRLPQRPADMSNLGKITTSGAAPTFAGPSSVFSKRGKAGAAATPPLSRQASTANMFSALNDAESAAAEPTPERKKLNLKPRSVPMPGEEKDGEDGEDADEEEEGEVAEDEVEEDKAPAVMSEDAAKIKIASDMKELWGEKDMGGSRNPEDIAEYFKALPEERQSLLSIQLIDDAFRLSKYKDAEVIAKGLKFALEQQVATLDVLQKGIENHMPGLDDDSIDFPQAYKAMALFMRSLQLSDDQITALLAKVDVYGEPRVTPTDKLNKALATIDEEGKA